MNMGALAAGLIILFVFAMVLLYALAIAEYVFGALGLFQLAKRRGIPNYWLAWIPIGNAYIMGRVVPVVRFGSWRIRDLHIWLPVSTGVIVALAMIMGMFSPGVGILMAVGGSEAALIYYIVLMCFGLLLTLAAIGVAILEYAVFYRIFKATRPEQAVLFLVLGILFSPLLSIFTFVVRNDSFKEDLSVC